MVALMLLQDPVLVGAVLAQIISAPPVGLTLGPPVGLVEMAAFSYSQEPIGSRIELRLFIGSKGF